MSTAACQRFWSFLIGFFVGPLGIHHGIALRFASMNTAVSGCSPLKLDSPASNCWQFLEPPKSSWIFGIRFVKWTVTEPQVDFSPSEIHKSPKWKSTYNCGVLKWHYGMFVFWRVNTKIRVVSPKPSKSSIISGCKSSHSSREKNLSVKPKWGWWLWPWGFHTFFSTQRAKMIHLEFI